jgi:hypothetical protein
MLGRFRLPDCQLARARTERPSDHSQELTKLFFAHGAGGIEVFAALATSRVHAARASVRLRPFM